MMLVAEMERLFAIGQFEDALAAAKRLHDLATQWDEEDLVGLARLYFGIIHHTMGNPPESERHLQWVRAWITPEGRARLRAAIGLDLPAIALAYSALNLWLLGYGEQALARSREAIAAARVEAAVVGQAASLALGANLLHLLRVDDAVGAGAMAEQSEQCHRLCVQQGLYMWRVFAEVLLGRLMVMAGEDVAGVERMQGAGWLGGTTVIETDFFTVLLADSCLLAASRRAPGAGTGAAAERDRLLATGLEAIDNLLGPARIPSWQAYQAEMSRLRGELLLARDGLAAAGEARECFRRAMQFGREKGALAWELRAAMSLVRLQEREDAPGAADALELAEARNCLAGVHARFTEGFAFPDLQDAAALLRRA